MEVSESMVGKAVHHGKGETPGAVSITRCGHVFRWLARLDCRACAGVEVGFTAFFSMQPEMQTSLH